MFVQVGVEREGGAEAGEGGQGGGVARGVEVGDGLTDLVKGGVVGWW